MDSHDTVASGSLDFSAADVFAETRLSPDGMIMDTASPSSSTSGDVCPTATCAASAVIWRGLLERAQRGSAPSDAVATGGAGSATSIWQRLALGSAGVAQTPQQEAQPHRAASQSTAHRAGSVEGARPGVQPAQPAPRAAVQELRDDRACAAAEVLEVSVAPSRPVQQSATADNVRAHEPRQVAVVAGLGAVAAEVVLWPPLRTPQRTPRPQALPVRGPAAGSGQMQRYSSATRSRADVSTDAPPDRPCPPGRSHRQDARRAGARPRAISQPPLPAQWARAGATAPAVRGGTAVAPPQREPSVGGSSTALVRVSRRRAQLPARLPIVQPASWPETSQPPRCAGGCTFAWHLSLRLVPSLSAAPRSQASAHGDAAGRTGPASSS
jgi:trimeric autotransporter adhesin